MDKQTYDTILKLIFSKKSNPSEIENINKILSYLEGEFDEAKVIEFITQNNRYDLKNYESTAQPDYDTIIDDLIEAKLFTPSSEN